MNVVYTVTLPPSPSGANAALGIVCPAKSRFNVELEPTAARPVGNTCRKPLPCDRVAVTFSTTAVAVAGTSEPVIWKSRVVFASIGALERVSAMRVGVIAT